MNEVKVVVIVLDGASFDVFHSLAEEGILPNFRKLKKEGVFNVLQSTIPPVSPVAMPSLATGKSPSKHGMFGFGKLVNGTFMPHTSGDIKVGALWDILTAAGKRVVVLNFPYTFPPYNVNGVMVSGFPSPRNIVKSYPPELIKLLKSEIGEYYVDLRYITDHYRGMDETRFLEEVYLVTKKREAALHYLMKNYEWDLFLAAFTSLDRIQHALFGYFDKESPLFNVQRREVLVQYYKEIDAILGRIISKIDENTILMISSDHGIEPLYKYVGVNNLLSQGGFVKVRSKHNLFNLETILSFLEKIGVRARIRTDISPKIILKVKQMLPSKFDYPASKAYITNSGAISINKNALENEETYENVKKKLMHFFHSIIDEETGEKIVEKIFEKNEIYPENQGDAPDLTIVFKKGYKPMSWVKNTIEPVRKIKNKTVETGTHSGLTAQRGIFIVSGEGIKKELLSKAKIVDVAPTVLHILGVPIPSDMDGRVLGEIFESKSRFAKRPIKYQHFLIEKDIQRMSKKDNEEIKSRLKSLGYI